MIFLASFFVDLLSLFYFKLKENALFYRYLLL